MIKHIKYLIEIEIKCIDGVRIQYLYFDRMLNH